MTAKLATASGEVSLDGNDGMQPHMSRHAIGPFRFHSFLGPADQQIARQNTIQIVPRILMKVPHMRLNIMISDAGTRSHGWHDTLKESLLVYCVKVDF